MNNRTVRSLEIALDCLDRIHGTIFYDCQKKAMGWNDDEYDAMLEDLSIIYLTFKKDRDNPEEEGDNDRL